MVASASAVISMVLVTSVVVGFLWTVASVAIRVWLLITASVAIIVMVPISIYVSWRSGFPVLLSFVLSLPKPSSCIFSLTLFPFLRLMSVSGRISFGSLAFLVSLFYWLDFVLVNTFWVLQQRSFIQGLSSAPSHSSFTTPTSALLCLFFVWTWARFTLGNYMILLRLRYRKTLNWLWIRRLFQLASRPFFTFLDLLQNFTMDFLCFFIDQHFLLVVNLLGRLRFALWNNHITQPGSSHHFFADTSFTLVCFICIIFGEVLN